jgi:DsbC/DsbD-like thiol-disulfide interchange protein
LFLIQCWVSASYCHAIGLGNINLLSAYNRHPGAGIYLGLHQKIIPHWHTYWVNPGDSGTATSIAWTLPEGATASDIIWPAPSRFSMGPITNYAYENDVTLLTKITVPARLNPGENFAVQALVDWLVCKEECIPQQVELTLSLPVVAATAAMGAGDARARIGDAITGVLVISEQSGDDASQTITRGFEVSSVVQAQVAEATTASISFVSALLLALIGGIILNLMPCVFPVLSIKALSLVSHANQSATQVRMQGVVYTLGVLASFALLAVLLILLKAGGAQIGWGFQFHSPLFVLAVAYLMFAVGLSLSGVFYIGGSVAGVDSSLTEKHGYIGKSFHRHPASRAMSMALPPSA